MSTKCQFYIISSKVRVTEPKTTGRGWWEIAIIEIGRHSRPKTPEDKRLCPKCKDIQDELHHLLICSPMADLRKPLLNSAAQCIKNFGTLSLEKQFSEILECTDNNLLTQLAIFLRQADNLLRGPLRHTP